MVMIYYEDSSGSRSRCSYGYESEPSVVEMKSFVIRFEKLSNEISTVILKFELCS